MERKTLSLQKKGKQKLFIMAKSKKYRANNTYLIEGGNPKLMGQGLSNGRDSLYLEYYDGFEEVVSKRGKTYKKIKRTNKRLNLFLWQSPRTPIERQENKETLELAKKIRFERGQELLEDKENYRLKKKAAVNLLDYFQEFAQSANVADRRVIEGALRNFKTFLLEEYPRFANRIEAKDLSKDKGKEMITKFVDWLVDNHKGQGVETYYRRFKRMVNYAVEEGVIAKSPCKGITTPKVDDILAKDILSQEELTRLYETHYSGENPEIRRAFALTCLAGVRLCDIVGLTYSNVDYSNRLLTYRQRKVQKHSKSSGVPIPLSDTLMAVIGTKKEDAPDDYIFHLPSSTMCLKALRRWTKRAGIEKHITWHCGRHSFATSLLSNGVNIKVVSSLLGHSTLKFTEIYVRAVDKLKEDAINSLPELSI